MKFKKFAVAALAFLLVFTMFAPTLSLAATKVSSVKFQTPAITLAKKGKTTTLKLTTSPKNVSNSNFKWTSSNGKVVAVTQAGKITAKAGSGKATITATSKANTKVKAKIPVYIGKQVTSVSLSKTSLSLTVGKNTTLKATAYPTNARYRTVTWKSSNTKVATVNSKGTVTAKGVGTAKIIATSGDGSNKKRTCTVTVKKAPAKPSFSVKNDPVADNMAAIAQFTLKNKGTKPMIIEGKSYFSESIYSTLSSPLQLMEGSGLNTWYVSSRTIKAGQTTDVVFGLKDLKYFPLNYTRNGVISFYFKYDGKRYYCETSYNGGTRYWATTSNS